MLHQIIRLTSRPVAQLPHSSRDAGKCPLRSARGEACGKSGGQTFESLALAVATALKWPAPSSMHQSGGPFRTYGQPVSGSTQLSPNAVEDGSAARLNAGERPLWSTSLLRP